jgi:hypothetical protein
MRLRRVRRPGLGLLVAVVAYVGLIALGDAPDTRDTKRQVASYFVDHRTSVLISAVMLDLAVTLFVVVVTRWRRLLTDVGAAIQGDLVMATGIVVTVLVLLQALVYATLSYVVGSETPDNAKALFELTLVLTPVVALPMAAMFTALASTPGLSMRVRSVGAVAALVAVVAGVSYAHSGPFSPDVQQSVLFTAFMIAVPFFDRAVRRLHEARGQ